MSRKSERRRPAGAGQGRQAFPIAVGIILRGTRVLVSRRQEGSHLAGTWEFPGGKILPGEAPEEALRREISEETGIRFEKARLIHRQQHTYSERDVDLHFFLCTGIVGEPSAVEGQEFRWVSAADLDHLPIPAANTLVIRMIQDQIS